MSEIAKELRDLARGVAGAAAAQTNSPAKWQPIWDRLALVGITEVATDRGPDAATGDLEDLSVCVEEIAAAGLSVPLIENSVGRWALGTSGADLCTVAVQTQEFDSDATTITASIPGVRWADSARTAVVVGRNTSGPLCVDLKDPHVEVSVRSNIADEPVATLRMQQAPFERLPDVTSDEVLTRLRLLRASALLAAARGAYDLTKTYVTVREQFGAPLVKLPAVANNLAQMKTEILQAEAALDRARDRDGSDLSTAARIARLMGARCASQVAVLAHQLHGAMGVTHEYPLHRLTRAIWAWRDADVSERNEAIALGRLVLAGGEKSLWESVTA